MNKVILVGRLTKDPELRYTQSGVAVATFTLAVNRRFTNQQGEREADFIQCQVWRRQAENAANYLQKGSKCGVVGEWRTRSYEGQDGKRVYVNECLVEELEFMGAPNNAQNGPNSSDNDRGNTNIPGGNQNANMGQNRGYNGGFNRDDDPFHNEGPISDYDLPF